MLFLMLLFPSLVMSRADDVCTYHFEVPKPAAGCVEGSTTLEERIARLESLMNIGEAGDEPAPLLLLQKDVKHQEDELALLKKTADGLTDKLSHLSSTAVLQSKLDEAIHGINTVISSAGSTNEMRLGNMTLAIQGCIQSQTQMAQSVQGQLQGYADRLGKYFQNLMDLKESLEEMDDSGNTSSISQVSSRLESVAENLYVSVGVNKARYEELTMKREKLEHDVLNHTDALNHLVEDVRGTVEHIHIMTDQVKALRDKVKIFDDYITPEIQTLESRIAETQEGQEKLFAEMEIVGNEEMNLTSSSLQKDALVKDMQTELDLLSHRILQITMGIGDQSSKVHDLSSNLEQHGAVDDIRRTLIHIKQNVYPALRMEYNQLMELKGKVGTIQKMFKNHVQMSRNNTIACQAQESRDESSEVTVDASS
ncbi:putative leucine-rich repeat-containing protein DDB_G0290503 [Haliotis asinina]|uniref:putative leucine-rich repeat-containing protein DDB_G0290503 n=1 Tax=Haliotis asinina TaxID=109174 RepID=UPI003531AA7D